MHALYFVSAVLCYLGCEPYHSGMNNTWHTSSRPSNHLKYNHLNRSADDILEGRYWARSDPMYGRGLNADGPPVNGQWPELRSGHQQQEVGSADLSRPASAPYDPRVEDPVDTYLRHAAPRKPPRSYADLSPTHWRKLTKLEQENRISKSMGDLRLQTEPVQAEDERGRLALPHFFPLYFRLLSDFCLSASSA